MAKKTFNKDEIYGNWKLIIKKSGGGNSFVFLAEHLETKEQKIIKLLKKTHETARLRFLDEIKIISENQEIEGIMRIVDYSNQDDDTLWYTMPLTIPLNEYLVDKPTIVKIDAILEIAKTLSQLHLKNVSHRDIKPQNLFYQDRYLIGDFGLVDYPDKENDLTIVGNSLGP